MESKAIITERAAESFQTEANQLADDLAAHAAKGLEAHADSRLLVGTPYRDDAGYIVTPDTFRFRTVRNDGVIILIDLPVVLFSGQALTNIESAPPPPSAPPPSTPPPSNPTPEPPPPSGGGGGGGGGCLLKLTRIKMADGTFRAIESLKPGDKLASYDMPPLDPNVESSWKTFQTANLKLNPVETNVVGLKIDKFTKYLVIEFDDGTTLRVTYEHLLPFEHDWLWKIDHVANIQVGDSVATVAGTKKVIGLYETVTNIITYNLDVEPFDLYIADNIVVHNSTIVHKY